MERKLIVDQIDENKAVLETEQGEIITVDAAFLPPEAQEGDIIRVLVDREQTEKKKEEIRNLLKDLWE